MTETQAKSSSAGPPAGSPEQDAPEASAPATGRAAVGRATVPADSPSPKFTRAPGMPAPPDRPSAETDAAPDGSPAAAPKASAAPAAAPAKKGSKGGGAAKQPAGPATSGNITTPIPTKAAPPPAVPAGRTGPPPAGPVSAPPGPDGATTRIGVPGSTAARATASVRTGALGTAAVGAARVTEAVRIARSTVSGAAGRGPRRARLHVKRIDPWSVMKFSFAVSLVLFIVMIVATSVLYLALDAMKVWESLNDSLADLVSASGGGNGAEGFKVTAKGVIGVSALLGAVNVVLFTALMTLGAFIYNVCADLVGGVEVTLAERE